MTENNFYNNSSPTSALDAMAKTDYNQSNLM